MKLGFSRAGVLVAAMLLAAAMLPATSSTADAGYRYYGYHGPHYYHTGYYRPYYRFGYRHYGYPYRHYGYRYRHYGYGYPYYRHRHGGAVAAGLFGLAAGAILSGALSQPRYYGYRKYHRARAGWIGSRAWYRYCRAKYRSFDPGSGTFQPYHGPRKLCR